MKININRFVITHTDDVCWTVNETRVYGPETKNPGETYLRAVSHHGTLEDAVQNVIRLLGDDHEEVDSLRGYVRCLARIWEEVKAELSARAGS